MDERYDIIRTVRDKRFRCLRNFEPLKPYYQHLDTPERGATMQEIRKAEHSGAMAKAAASFSAGRKPAEELCDLKNDPHEINNLAADPAHVETLARQTVETTFTMPASGQTGLRLGDGENSFDIFVDAEKRQLVFDPRKLPAEAHHIPNDKRIFTQPLTAKPGEKITLRVFLDGPLVEVFCNDLDSAQRAWFAEPDGVKASQIGQAALISSSWPLGSIWK